MSRWRRRLARVPGVVRFAAFYAGELTVSNLVVAREVLTPRPRLIPALVEVNLRSTTRVDVLLLTGLVSLTPGTLVLAGSTAPARLLVHGLDGADPERLVGQVLDLEARMLRARHGAVGPEDAP